ARVGGSGTVQARRYPIREYRAATPASSTKTARIAAIGTLILFTRAIVLERRWALAQLLKVRAQILHERIDLPGATAEALTFDLWTTTIGRRSTYGAISQVRSSARHARPARPESRRRRTDPRLRHRAAAETHVVVGRGGSAGAPVPGPASPRAARLAPGGVDDVRDRAGSEVLHAHPRGPRTDREGGGGLEAARRCGRGHPRGRGG